MWQVRAAGVLGASSVAAGAYGAHGLKVEDEYKTIWRAAVQYHQFAAVSLLATAAVPSARARLVAGIGILAVASGVRTNQSRRWRHATSLRAGRRRLQRQQLRRRQIPGPVPREARAVRGHEPDRRLARAHGLVVVHFSPSKFSSDKLNVVSSTSARLSKSHVKRGPCDAFAQTCGEAVGDAALFLGDAGPRRMAVVWRPGFDGDAKQVLRIVGSCQAGGLPGFPGFVG